MKLKRPISLGWRAAYVVCAVLCVSADQLTKRIIEQKLPLYSRVRLFGPVSLTHLRNSGAAFGLFQGSSLLLAVIGFAVLGAAVAIWGIGFGSTKMRWGLVFLASGSVGNLIDRLVRGAVVDFVDLGFWPVFNLADVLIVTGVLLALCAALFDKDVLDQPAGRTTTRLNERLSVMRPILFEVFGVPVYSYGFALALAFAVSTAAAASLRVGMELIRST